MQIWRYIWENVYDHSVEMIVAGVVVAGGRWCDLCRTTIGAIALPWWRIGCFPPLGLVVAYATAPQPHWPTYSHLLQHYWDSADWFRRPWTTRRYALDIIRHSSDIIRQ